MLYVNICLYYYWLTEDNARCFSLQSGGSVGSTVVVIDVVGTFVAVVGALVVIGGTVDGVASEIDKLLFKMIFWIENQRL